MLVGSHLVHFLLIKLVPVPGGESSISAHNLTCTDAVGLHVIAQLEMIQGLHT